MQAKPIFLIAAAVIAFSSYAFGQGQQEHQQHHPGSAPTQVQPGTSGPQPAQLPPPTPGELAAGESPGPTGQMMQGMPERCRKMMQNMPRDCGSMMHEMMRGDMRQGGMMGREGMTHGTPGASTSVSGSTKAYMEAVEKTYAPIMEGLQAGDPDVAFARALIAYHRGAIELAKIRLQFGKDEITQKWADDTIKRQQAEIEEMQAWLEKQNK